MTLFRCSSTQITKNHLRNLLQRQVCKVDLARRTFATAAETPNPNPTKSQPKRKSYTVFRFDPTKDDKPYFQTWFERKDGEKPKMLLDALFQIKEDNEDGLAFRRSCREGICGSCAMNINGTNTLACTTILDESVYEDDNIRIFPLPHMPVVRDLVVDMSVFYTQHKSIDPYLKESDPVDEINLQENQSHDDYSSNIMFTFSEPSQENYQSRQDRAVLDGLYECILCACCSTSCPSYWWNQEKYLGPAVLLQAYRWIADSRDRAFEDRLDFLDDEYKVNSCHNILNCVQCCPKGLSPVSAISNIKSTSKLIKKEDF